MTLCGENCKYCICGKSLSCGGCEQTEGHPFGKECFIYDHIQKNGKVSYEALKAELICEFNSFNIKGMPNITELFAINGALVKTAYPIPDCDVEDMLDEREIYLGIQVECEDNGKKPIKIFALLANKDIMLVIEYGENFSNSRVLIFKRR